MERTNEMWLEHLQDNSLHQAEALEDLRKYLKRGVVSYLYTRNDLNYLADAELRQMSEDFVQEALLKVRAKSNTFQGRSKLTTWAAKIATNHTISELRRAKWRDLSLDAITEAGTSLQEILLTDASKAGNPDTENERRQVWEMINQVINNDLTERQRQALSSVLIENMPIAEVARLLNTNINNIYKLLHDARLKLKRHIQALGLDTQSILKLFSENR